MAKTPVPRSAYVPKGYVALPQPAICKKLNLEVYVGNNANGQPCAIAFHGKAKKPDFHYRYTSNDLREEAIARWMTTHVQFAEKQAARRAEKKAFRPTVVVGDIFRCSWGYDQTNVDYFQVVGVSGKHALVQEIYQQRIEEGRDYGRCVPAPGAFVPGSIPQRKLIQNAGGREYFRVNSFSTATKLSFKEPVPGVKVYESSYWSSYA